MRTPLLALVVLALVFGGCAAPDESLPTAPLEAPTTYATSSSTSSTPTSTVTTVTPTSSTSTTTTMPPPTTSTVPASPLVLQSDGLGVVVFGDPVENVMTILTDLFGPPSYDRLLESPFDAFADTGGPYRGPNACNTLTGHVCFDYIRFVSWGDVGLGVVFADSTFEAAASSDDVTLVKAPPGFRGYTYSGGDGDQLAHTAEGITIGSTVADLRRVYSDAVTFGLDVCGEVPEFSVKDPSSAESGWFRGSLEFDEHCEWKMLDSGHVDPESLDPDATVRLVAAGVQSSC